MSPPPSPGAECVAQRAGLADNQMVRTMDYSAQKYPYRMERFGILVFSCLYLAVFNVNLPNGDALRIVRQIEESRLTWNPNHLLLDPLGYYWHALLERLGFDIVPLASFEIISAVAAIVSLLLFHAVLVAAGIRGRATRIIAVAAVFAAKNFLSLAVNQYYFMVQMPLLLAALLLCIRMMAEPDASRRRVRDLYLSAVLLAVATGIEINNVLLVFLLGLVLAASYQPWPGWAWRNTVHFWGAAALTGIPVFIAGYLLSGNDNGFFTWLLSYAGANNAALEQVYGLQLTLKGIAVSAAKVVYNLFFGNFIETAGLGTVLRGLVFSEPLEFRPGVLSLTLACLLMPVVGGLHAFIFLWASRRIGGCPVCLLLLVWVAAYIFFAFFWDTGSNIFWFQTIPAICLLFARYVADRGAHAAAYGGVSGKKIEWLLAGTVVALLVVNTLHVVVPVAWVDLEKSRAEHAGLLRNGDLEIMPGWDKYKWMGQDPGGKDVERFMLMNMVLKPSDHADHIANLPDIIDAHLSAGGRVVVARVYDLDSEISPWINMARMGWPRQRILKMLEGYCNREIGRIDDAGFRELFACEPRAE